MSKKDPIFCNWSNSCDCVSKNKEKQCEMCAFYWWIDSGYGYCRALPKHIAVPWCRDICSLFKAREAK